jgi:ubiquinone/menaquinone biosynthesis C-methylase UbiE
MAHARRVRRIYDHAAASYDASGIGRWFDRLRARLLAQASGDVLELGVGTGATMPFYRGTVRSLTAIDVSPRMLDRARDRAAGLTFPVTFLEADFQTLPFPDGSFDTVVASLALCGIPDPPRLYGEMRRVLRPAGALLGVEHVRPGFAPLGLAFDAITPITERTLGCAWNRRTTEQLRESGFDVSVRERRLFGMVVTFVARPRV